MMRPMKLAGDQLMFGAGCLAHLAQLETRRAMVVTGGSSMKKNGILKQVCDYLEQAGAAVRVFEGVEPDPSFATVFQGAAEMQAFQPDLIVALGGGSAMDAAKGMWIYYEHPELKTPDDLLTANPFPRLRAKARLCCIPSTAGTASEVSRSIVLSDDQGIKHGLGNMEMMPDIAICDPVVTVTLPPHITAETGMDALTHAIEAAVSQRANAISDVLADQAVRDIVAHLPRAYAHGDDLEARTAMLNASMMAGMAFTNVSLGIVHSMAHTVGSLFHIAHGLADAIILPYVIAFNRRDARAQAIYQRLADLLQVSDIQATVKHLNDQLGIPHALKAVIPDAEAYRQRVHQMADMALADGCTKTNPIVPDVATFERLLMAIYEGEAV